MAVAVQPGVVGAIASRLAQYVYELQQGKKKYAKYTKELEAGIVRSKKLSDELLNLAEVDAYYLQSCHGAIQTPARHRGRTRFQKATTRPRVCGCRPTAIRYYEKNG